MNSSTMIASTRPAVNNPMPYGGPWNNGPMISQPPNVSINHGCTVCCRIGPNTNKPQMPNTMLGTAANNSIAVLSGARSRVGQISVMKTAMPKLIGTAVSIAINDVTTVP